MSPAHRTRWFWRIAAWVIIPLLAAILACRGTLLSEGGGFAGPSFQKYWKHSNGWPIPFVTHVRREIEFLGQPTSEPALGPFALKVRNALDAWLPWRGEIEYFSLPALVCDLAAALLLTLLLVQVGKRFRRSRDSGSQNETEPASPSQSSPPTPVSPSSRGRVFSLGTMRFLVQAASCFMIATATMLIASQGNLRDTGASGGPEFEELGAYSNGWPVPFLWRDLPLKSLLQPEAAGDQSDDEEDSSHPRVEDRTLIVKDPRDEWILWRGEIEDFSYENLLWDLVSGFTLTMLLVGVGWKQS